MMALLLLVSQAEIVKKAHAYLETQVAEDGSIKGEETLRHAGLAALALGSGAAADRIVGRFAKEGPTAVSYPNDFAMAYNALAVIGSKDAKAAKTFVDHLISTQNKEGDWAYDFQVGEGRWTETTMNVPILEALLTAREAKIVFDEEAIKRSVAFLTRHQVEDGRFRSDTSETPRPPSTEATAALVAVLARADKEHAAVKKGAKALVKVEEVLAAIKDGRFQGVTEDDRATHGPDCFPYAFYYTALAERRLGGAVKDAKRKEAILKAVAAWQGEDGSFPSSRGKVYGTAMTVLALKALFE